MVKESYATVIGCYPRVMQVRLPYGPVLIALFLPNLTNLSTTSPDFAAKLKFSRGRAGGVTPGQANIRRALRATCESD